MSNQERERNRNLGRLIDSVASGECLPALQEYLNSVVESDTFFVAAYLPDSPPVLIYHKTWDREEENYATGPYLLDPFYISWSEGLPDGCYRLKDVAPSGFEQSQYYTTYYRQLNQRDEVVFFTKVNNTATITVSLGRGLHLPSYRSTEATRLDNLTPVVRSVAREIWRHSFDDHKVEQADRLFHQQISDAFTSFGTSCLTARESEIAHLLLKGHSAKSIADFLKIAVDTVRTHQKNIYSKLDIRSQSELFGLFLEALGQFSPKRSADPLGSM